MSITKLLCFGGLCLTMHRYGLVQEGLQFRLPSTLLMLIADLISGISAIISRDTLHGYAPHRRASHGHVSRGPVLYRRLIANKGVAYEDS
jgi:hypothetical protein